MEYGKSSERMKRDEWSEGAVAALLDAYEKKWVLRNRAKLKGDDWEEVSQQVCARNGGTKPFKTQSQCKNKIEALKKRYRSEVSNLGNPIWPFFNRMDLLLRCPAIPFHYADAGRQPVLTQLALQEGSPQLESAHSEQMLKTKDGFHMQSEFIQRNGHVDMARLSPEDASNTLLAQRKESASDATTPRSKMAHGVDGFGKEAAKRRKKSLTSEFAETIRSFSDSIVKLEHAKMEMYKEAEHMRAQAESRRLEMELKRTETIAKTQLQIAKLLIGKVVKRKASTIPAPTSETPQLQN